MKSHILYRHKQVTVIVVLRNTDISKKETEASSGPLKCKEQKENGLYSMSWKVQLSKEKQELNSILFNLFPATLGKLDAEGASGRQRKPLGVVGNERREAVKLMPTDSRALGPLLQLGPSGWKRLRMCQNFLKWANLGDIQ